MTGLVRLAQRVKAHFESMSSTTQVEYDAYRLADQVIAEAPGLKVAEQRRIDMEQLNDKLRKENEDLETALTRTTETASSLGVQLDATKGELLLAQRNIVALESRITELEQRPPMACSACEEHNEDLADIVAALVHKNVSILSPRALAMLERITAGTDFLATAVKAEPLTEEGFNELIDSLKAKPDLPELVHLDPNGQTYTLTRDIAVSGPELEKFVESGGRLDNRGYKVFVSGPADLVTFAKGMAGGPLAVSGGDGAGQHLFSGGAVIGVDPSAPGQEVTIETTVQIVNNTKVIEHGIRGVDFPCEACGKLEGSVRDNRGFNRCTGCGFPGQ